MDKPFELMLALNALQTDMLRTLNRRMVHGLSFSEFLAMYRLSQSPGKAMRRIELAESVGLSASGVTRLLAPMEKLGLVEKEPNPRDARVSLVKLSGPGEAILHDALQSVTEAAQHFFAPLDDAETERLLALVKTVL